MKRYMFPLGLNNAIANAPAIINPHGPSHCTKSCYYNCTKAEVLLDARAKQWNSICS